MAKKKIKFPRDFKFWLIVSLILSVGILGLNKDRLFKNTKTSDLLPSNIPSGINIPRPTPSIYPSGSIFKSPSLILNDDFQNPKYFQFTIEIPQKWTAVENFWEGNTKGVYYLDIKKDKVTISLNYPSGWGPSSCLFTPTENINEKGDYYSKYSEVMTELGILRLGEVITADEVIFTACQNHYGDEWSNSTKFGLVNGSISKQDYNLQTLREIKNILSNIKVTKLD